MICLILLLITPILSAHFIAQKNEILHISKDILLDIDKIYEMTYVLPILNDMKIFIKCKDYINIGIYESTTAIYYKSMVNTIANYTINKSTTGSKNISIVLIDPYKMSAYKVNSYTEKKNSCKINTYFVVYEHIYINDIKIIGTTIIGFLLCWFLI